jgi:hypothetical protein
MGKRRPGKETAGIPSEEQGKWERGVYIAIFS